MCPVEQANLLWPVSVHVRPICKVTCLGWLRHFVAAPMKASHHAVRVLLSNIVAGELSVRRDDSNLSQILHDLGSIELPITQDGH